MLRITKLTDYAVVVATHMANRPLGRSYNVPDLARDTGIPLPTVGKVLKILAKEGIVVSQRGVHGGYYLARDPEDIRIAELIVAIEGPIAVTECSSDTAHACDLENRCSVRANWQLINGAVQQALEGIRLSDMARTMAPTLVRIGRSSAEAEKRHTSLPIEKGSA